MARRYESVRSFKIDSSLTLICVSFHGCASVELRGNLGVGGGADLGFSSNKLMTVQPEGQSAVTNIVQNEEIQHHKKGSVKVGSLNQFKYSVQEKGSVKA